MELHILLKHAVIVEIDAFAKLQEYRRKINTHDWASVSNALKLLKIHEAEWFVIRHPR